MRPGQLVVSFDPSSVVNCYANEWGTVGTVAAAWQASIGNVVAGSLFATLQSMTMTGTLVVVGGGLIAVGAAGLAGGVEWARGVDWAKGVDWTNGEHWAQWAEAAGLSGIVMEQWTRSMELVCREGWKRTEEGVRSVDWEGVAKGVEWAGQEARKRTEEGIRSVDWEGVGEGIKRAFTWW